MSIQKHKGDEMKVMRINGNKVGVNLSIPAHIYFSGGVEYFARVVVANCQGDKQFAIQQLRKIAMLNNVKLIINNKEIF